MAIDCCEIMGREWLEARVAATKAQIESIEDAILQLSTGAVQSYALDSGQTRQSVTKLDLGSLRLQQDQLYTRLEWLKARLCGVGVYVGPGF